VRKNGSWTISHPPRMAPQPFETGPVIDAVYPFEKAEEAFEHLRSANHFGKLVIQVSVPGA